MSELTTIYLVETRCGKRYQMRYAYHNLDRALDRYDRIELGDGEGKRIRDVLTGEVLICTTRRRQPQSEVLSD